MKATMTALKTTMTALVLGGGQDKLAQEQKVASKALLTIKGKAMAQYVLEALKKSEFISDITFIGTINDSLRPWLDTVVNSGQNLAASLAQGISATKMLKPSSYFVITADLPWVTQEAIDDFIKNAPDADLVYVAIPETVAKKQFPKQKRTFVNIKEGRFTGGNVLLLKPKAEHKLIPFINRAYAARKNPLKLAYLVGLRTTVALLVGQLKLATLEQRVSQLLDLKVRVYVSNYASLGADVDKLEHLQEAQT